MGRALISRGSLLQFFSLLSIVFVFAGSCTNKTHIKHGKIAAAEYSLGVSERYIDPASAPFLPRQVVELTLQVESVVNVSVFDATGEFVYQFYPKRYSAGKQMLSLEEGEFMSRGFSSGVYFLKIVVGENVFLRKMSILK